MKKIVIIAALVCGAWQQADAQYVSKVWVPDQKARDAGRRGRHGRPVQRSGRRPPPKAVSRLDGAQLRLRGAGHRGIHAAGDLRHARHVAQRRLHAQVETQAAHRRIGSPGARPAARLLRLTVRAGPPPRPPARLFGPPARFLPIYAL